MKEEDYLQILQVNLRSSLECPFQSPDLNHIPTENMWVLNKQVHAGRKLVGGILTIIESNLLTFLWWCRNYRNAGLPGFTRSLSVLSFYAKIVHFKRSHFEIHLCKLKENSLLPKLKCSVENAPRCKLLILMTGFPVSFGCFRSTMCCYHHISSVSQFYILTCNERKCDTST